MKKPVIGITCPWSVETWNDSMETGGYYYAGRPYVEAISKYGGTPILLPPEYTEESLNDHLDSIIEVVDGLLFTGGGDVKRKSDEGLPTLRGQQPHRYDFEAALMKKAYEKNIPIIGICRGFQMILEVFGGTLSDDVIDNHKQNLSGGEPWHEVEVNEDSRLFKMVGEKSWDVNSFHIQKADAIPDGFIVAAKSKDDVIESVESIGEPYIAGYQFHPEELSWNDDKAGEVFKLFIKAASEK